MEAAESENAEVRNHVRIRYTREEILEIKKNAPKLDPEQFCHVSASVLRGSRNHNKTTSFTKPQSNERSRDTSCIVLGPQKRTWNTGCHVSQRVGRDTAETTTPRWAKFSAEGRGGDKTYLRTSGEYRREFRSGESRGSSHNRGREKGTTFSRSYNKEERFNRDYKVSNSLCENEPEWFSEGPTTITETIELGGILEESGDCPSPGDKSRPQSIEQTETLKGVPHYDLGENVSDFHSSEAQHTCTAQLISTMVPTVGFDPVKVSMSSIEQNMMESQGSRFKHLFHKVDSHEEHEKTSNVNERLCKILKSSGNAAHCNQEKYNVFQVESKLRSILLGHHPASVTEMNGQGSKSRILTVEEIEAQFRSAKNVSEPRLNPSAFEDKSLKFHTTTNSEANRNVIPLLQSLMLKQQKPVCPLSLHLQNSVQPPGIFSTGTNALSASARINELQHTDAAFQKYPDSDSLIQGPLKHLWSSDYKNAASPTKIAPQNSGFPGSTQLPGIFGSTMYSDGLPRPVAPSLPHFVSPSGLPRRPIVKAQHNLIPNAQSFPLVGSSNHASMAVDSSVQQANNCRLMSMSPRQSDLGVDNASANLLNKTALSHYPQSYANFSALARSGSQVLGNTMSPISVNNNSVNHTTFNQFNQIKPLQQMNDDSTFFSQLLNWGRGKQSSSPDSVLSTKAKALEEIEQETVINDHYF